MPFWGRNISNGWALLNSMTASREHILFYDGIKSILIQQFDNIAGDETGKKNPTGGTGRV